jgi:hypothetical protein
MSVETGDLEVGARYRFIVAAANVRGPIRARVVNLSACELWPLMLELDDGEYLFVRSDECWPVRRL